MSMMRNMHTMEVEPLKDFQAESKIVPQTDDSRQILQGMMEVYNAQTYKDAWLAKVELVHWLNRMVRNKPNGLSEGLASRLRSLSYSAQESAMETALNGLKGADHYLLEIMAEMMSKANIDVYEARKELMSIINGNAPKILTQDTAYMNKLKLMSQYNVSAMVIQYATHNQRMSAIEALVHFAHLDPKKAIDLVAGAQGNELVVLLKGYGINTSDELEHSHDDHKREYEEALAQASIQEVVKPVVSKPEVTAAHHAPVATITATPVVADPVVVAPVVAAPTATPAQQPNVVTGSQSSSTSYGPWAFVAVVMAAFAIYNKNNLHGLLIRCGLFGDENKRSREGLGEPGEQDGLFADEEGQVAKRTNGRK